jgi:peptidoglycan/xylan/chitin deacetylase (PgdA/CDA1 family)
MRWPGGRRAALSLSFDNLGEVADLGRGVWPPEEPLGRHTSVTRALPRVQALLEASGLRATFFVEGRNAELYPGTLRALAAAGHEVACHGWCHEAWADLTSDAERVLLQRARDAMGELDVTPSGFRPPGGRLTGATLELLRELGFAHCSPAGRGAGVRDGIAVLPFDWRLVDAYWVLPRFGALRERDCGTPDPRPPSAHVAALREAIDRGGHVSAVLHPFLLEDPARLAALQGLLSELAEDAALWCAPHAEVAAWLAQAGTDPPVELRLDRTPA